MKKFKFEEIAINSTAKKKPIEEDKHTYLGLDNLDPGTLKVTRFGSEVAPIGEKLLMKKGDVLFGKRRAYQKKVAIAPFDGIFSAHGMVLRPREEVVYKDFFPLFISSDYFLDEAIRISVGSLSPTINWRDLRTLEFKLPTLEKQKELSIVLWSIIDTIESYKDLIVKTDELIKSRFISIMDKSEKEVNLLDICRPKQWRTIATKDLLEEGYPVYGANGIIGYTDTYNHEDETILIGCRGTCGNVMISEKKSYVNGNAMCLEELADDIHLDYLATYLKLYDFTKIITGTTQPQITIEGLAKVKVKLLEQEDETRFVNFFAQAEDTKKELNFTLDNLQKLYKKIIKSYFENDIKEN